MRSRGALPEVSFFDGGVAGVEVVVEAVFPGDRASGPELGDFGLADFGVGGEQHHLVAGLHLTNS